MAKILVTGASGSGKTTLATTLSECIDRCKAGQYVTAYDLDTFGRRVAALGEPGTHYIVPRNAVERLLRDPRDVWCFGLCRNLRDDVPYAEFVDRPVYGQIDWARFIFSDASLYNQPRMKPKVAHNIWALPWDQIYLIVWDPDCPGEYDRRFTSDRVNSYGKDPTTRAAVEAYARELYHAEPEDGVTRIDATGQSATTTLAHITALTLRGR